MAAGAPPVGPRLAGQAKVADTRIRRIALVLDWLGLYPWSGHRRAGCRAHRGRPGGCRRGRRGV